MSKVVLITGASGLVGTRLTEVLLEKGYSVSHLGRSKTSKKSIKSYIWDIHKGFIEDGALENANIVVHLAGAGVADKRWTKKRKQEILHSRVQSTSLLYSKLALSNTSCEAVIAASAIGIYGLNTGDTWLREGDPSGDGFLAMLTKQWEKEIKRLYELRLRVVTLRTGIALSEKGGALPKIAQSIRLNMGAVLGSGDQYMSWIHLDDLCKIFVKAIEDLDVRGVFNAVAPNPVTNRKFTLTLARVMNKRIWLPSVPGMVLKALLGEMATMVLGGNRVSPNKIQSLGFHFQYEELEVALESIIVKKKKVIVC